MYVYLKNFQAVYILIDELPGLNFFNFSVSIVVFVFFCGIGRELGRESNLSAN